MLIMNEKDYLTDRTIDKWSSKAEELYDISTVIKIAFVATVVAIAAPPIPGSAFAVLPLAVKDFILFS